MATSGDTAGARERRASTARRVALLALLLAACDPPGPRYPPFAGTETDAWFAYEVTLPHPRPDLGASFAISARRYGCSVEGIARPHSVRHSRGVVASCDDGTIALVGGPHNRIGIGCAKPTTRAQCDALLQRISDAGQP